MIWKAWPKTWPGSTRSVEALNRMRSVARPEDGPRVFTPRRRCTLAGPPVLHKVFGRSGTLCRPLRCKGRGQDPAQPEAGCPLHRTAFGPRSFGPSRYGSARWPSLPQSPLYSPLQPFMVALMRGLVRRGSARLACARPAVGVRSLRHAPCTHGLLLASLRGRSTAEDVGCSLPCRSASTAPHMHHAVAPQMQARPHRASIQRAGKGSRRRSSVTSRPGRPLLPSWPKALRRPP
jgi:hypothetical protein